MALGIIFAFVALFAWGFGDFFIQRASRAVGVWKSLFLIGASGVIALSPFIARELPALFSQPRHIGILVLAGIVVLFTALFEFESLRRGKLAIVEPVLALELPVTVGLSVILWGESLSLAQWTLVGTVFISIVLVITKHHTHLHYHRRIALEKGVLLAGLGAIGMGLFNFLVGIGAQETSPLMTVWFTNLVFTVVCLMYLIRRGALHELAADFRKYPGSLIGVCILDNLAWIAIASAMALIPIAIAITVSESYIALTVFLGLFVNREKLRYHQYVGAALAIVSVILLATTL